MPLTISQILAKNPRGTGPVWTGPYGSGPNGGISYSMLCRFLTCRERFRLYAIQGLKAAEQFNHRLEYGNMWHVCEEAFARGNDPTRGGRTRDAYPLWGDALVEYVKKLYHLYPLDRDKIDHWWNVCRVQFPFYVDYWSKHPDMVKRTPLLQEHVFGVDYKVPSGRHVRLRGKWDSVDLVPSEGIWLQENKAKGDVDEAKLKRQLTFDLQTMMYLLALRTEENPEFPPPLRRVGYPILGVRYNVIRRPLSGGKGTIVRHKATKNKPAETKEHFYLRVAQYINDEPETYFMRWRVGVSEGDIARFRAECLDPILENLLDWYDQVANGGARSQNVPTNYVTPMNWRHPFGVWNSIDETGSSEVDYYLETGSTIGLHRVDNLFPELSAA